MTENSCLAEDRQDSIKKDEDEFFPVMSRVVTTMTVSYWVKSKSQKCSKRVILTLLALEHHDPKKAPAESKRQQHWPLNTVPLEKRRMVWLFLPLQQQLISCEEITTKKSRLCLPARSIKMEGAW